MAKLHHQKSQITPNEDNEANRIQEPLRIDSDRSRFELHEVNSLAEQITKARG